MSLRKFKKLHVSPSKRASKFKFTIYYEYVHLSCVNNWTPSDLQVLWFRGQRSKTSTKPHLNVGGKSKGGENLDCIATWKPTCQVELVVTLYKDFSGAMFRKKEYMFVLENVSGAVRKKLGIFPCNMAEYVSEGSDLYDLEMEFKPVSKKVSAIRVGIKIGCEFIKEGKPLDDDMMSNFSHMSEPDLRRLSDLADFSDDEDEDKKLANIQEDLNEAHSDSEINANYSDDEPVQSNSSEMLAKRSQHTWSQFLDEMKTLEIKNIAMIGNPLVSKNDSSRSSVSSDVSSTDEFPSSADRSKRRVVSALFEERESHEEEMSSTTLPANLQPTEIESVKNKDTRYTNQEKTPPSTRKNLDEKQGSNNDGSSQNGSKNFKFGFINMQIPGSARNKNKTTLPSDMTETLNAKQREIEEHEHREREHLSQIRKFEDENKSLLKRNVALEQEVSELERDRDELQAEINELQLLVEDMKVKLSKSEASEKKVIKESKEILAKMNIRGWLCKKGIKGLTGRKWRRRWFATDDSGKLYYYKRSNNKTPRGYIDLDDIVAVQNVRESCQDINNASFNILTTTRKYEMMAHDEDEKHKWINALDYLRHWRSHTLTIQTFNGSGDSPQLSTKSRSSTSCSDLGNPFV